MNDSGFCFRADEVFQRHEPIGYDSKRNAFWLIGGPRISISHGIKLTCIAGDRLWIQRVPPKPLKSRKRKRPTESEKADRPSQKVNPPKRLRTKSGTVKAEAAPSRLGRGRAAKLQAKIKLDAQAKELVEFNRQTRGNRQTTRASKSSNRPSRSLGTRVSARLRGVQTNEWQSIPDEWLDESSDTGRQANSDDGKRSSRGLQQALGNQDDSVSELTELSDDSDNPDAEQEASGTRNEDVDNDTAEGTNLSVKDEEVEDQSVDGFIEWETVGLLDQSNLLQPNALGF